MVVIKLENTQIIIEIMKIPVNDRFTVYETRKHDISQTLCRVMAPFLQFPQNKQNENISYRLCVAQMYFLRKAFLCSKKFRRLS
jgi:hypothetical protein